MNMITKDFLPYTNNQCMQRRGRRSAEREAHECYAVYSGTHDAGRPAVRRHEGGEGPNRNIDKQGAEPDAGPANISLLRDWVCTGGAAGAHDCGDKVIPTARRHIAG